jgi:hypothetical protein
MGTGGPFPGGKARPGRDADNSPHLVPRLRMSRSYTSSHPKRLHHFAFAGISSASSTLVTLRTIVPSIDLEQHSGLVLERCYFKSRQVNSFNPSGNYMYPWFNSQWRWILPIELYLFVSYDTMSSSHGVHEMNAYRADHVCLSVRSSCPVLFLIDSSSLWRPCQLLQTRIWWTFVEFVKLSRLCSLIAAQCFILSQKCIDIFLAFVISCIIVKLLSKRQNSLLRCCLDLAFFHWRKNTFN